MEQNFEALTGANAGTGWRLQGDAGFYIHRNRVYLQGEIATLASPLPGTTLLTGLPAETRPSSPVAVTLQADRFAGIDVATPGITLPLTFAATANPDGTLVLDALPPYADTAPASPPFINWHWDPAGGWTFTPDFPDPFSYTVVLGDVSYPIGTFIDDVAVWAPFGPLLGGDFTDIDSEYAVHDARVHLRGRVQAAVDDATLLTSSLPGLLSAGLSSSADSYAIAQANGEGVVLDLEEPSIIVESAYDGRPATSFIGTNNSHTSPAPPVAGLRFLPRIGSPQGVSSPDPDFPTGLFGGVNIFQTAEANWSGVTDGSGNATTSLNVGAILAALFPTPPDWFILGINEIPGDFPTGSCEVSGFPPPGQHATGGYSMDAGVGMIMTGGVLPGGAGWVGGGAPSTFGIGMFDDVWGPVPGTDFPFPGRGLGPPGGWLVHEFFAFDYDKDPTNPNSTLLWRPGDVTGITQSLGSNKPNGMLRTAITLTAYWETKEDYLKAGDVLTLDGAGWQNPFSPPTPPAPPSDIAAAAASPGVRPLPTRRKAKLPYRQ